MPTAINCELCGAGISKYDQLEYDGLCKDCYCEVELSEEADLFEIASDFHLEAAY